MNSIDPVTADALEEVGSFEHPHCVTARMPTHRSGGDGHRQDAIRFGNLSRSVQEALRDDGLGDAPLRVTAEALDSVARDGDFWAHQGRGLMLYLAPGENGTEFLRTFRLSEPVEERVAVGGAFEVLPLLAASQDAGPYHVLAVSRNKVRLLSGDKFGLTERHPDALPESLRDALNIDEYQEHLGGHAQPVSGAGGRVAERTMYHGHGSAGADVQKSDELEPFFRRLANALGEIFSGPPEPLVFAGVEYYFPMFKEAYDGRGLLPGAVEGNPDELSAEQLHERAWPLVAKTFHESAAAARDRYQNDVDDSVRSGDLSEILTAAASGRVDTLFVAAGESVFGTLADADGMPVATANEDGDVNLLDRAASFTLRNGGRVLVLPRDEMPADSTVAGLFRFPLPAGVPA